jgi:adenylylsulfate kinase
VSWALWVTGIPGSGKSTLARAAAQRLRASGMPVRLLELDEIRKFVTPSPSYSDTERDVVYRGLVYLAWVLVESGQPVIIDATAHRRAWRDLARASIARFAEVQLACSTEEARRREETRVAGHAPRDIYARAGTPGATVPGIDVPYEPALAPELTVDTTALDVPAGADAIAQLAFSLFEPRPGTSPATSPAWAVWITGLPGSGKTTLAWSVAERLKGREAPVRVLDVAEARMLMLDGRHGSECEEEILHRTIVYGAKLLTEAGVSVLIDATGPRRSWRDAARDVLERFAEVQLVCPRDVCLHRERAVRWHLGSSGPTSPTRTPVNPGPDIVLDYEESLRPELVLHTDVQHASTGTEAILVVLSRLATGPEEEASSSGSIA